MIEPRIFFDALSQRGVDFYSGVPDSLLANFCAYVDDQSLPEHHIIAANEGNAIAIAMGYHMATKKVAVVYMQNSGLGNAVNPITSLADPEVYKIPMLLIIGWRGEPGTKDEPQHVKQGRVTLDQLHVLEIPYFFLDSETYLDETLDLAFDQIRQRNAPVALIVRKNTFAEYKSSQKILARSTLRREMALDKLLELLSSDDLVIATTGKTSRELFELRAKLGHPQRDFLTVGGMGHTSSIALGVAIGQKKKRIICLDGDGSMLMHMGAMPVIGTLKPLNFIHVLLNNCSHESVGGQATSAGIIDFKRLSKAVGYSGFATASDLSSLEQAWKSLAEVRGPSLLELKVANGSRSDLGRPTSSAEHNKKLFMEAVFDGHS